MNLKNNRNLLKIMVLFPIIEQRKCMSLKEKRNVFSSLDDFLDDDNTVHIDIEEIECITYDDESTGNVSALTAYLHGSVRKVLQKIDSNIKTVLSHQNLTPTS